MLNDVGNSLLLPWPFTAFIMPLPFCGKCFVFNQYGGEINVLYGCNRRLTVKTADSSILSSMSPDMDYRNSHRQVMIFVRFLLACVLKCYNI